jgi:hypothetical protein
MRTSTPATSNFFQHWLRKASRHPAQMIAYGLAACDNYGGPGVVAQSSRLKHRTCSRWDQGVLPGEGRRDAIGRR